MAYNREYPYNDAGRFDVDWLINKVKELEDKLAAIDQSQRIDPVSMFDGFRCCPIPDNIQEIAQSYDLEQMGPYEFYSLWDGLVEQVGNSGRFTRKECTPAVDQSGEFPLYYYEWTSRVSDYVGRKTAGEGEEGEYVNDHYEKTSQTWPGMIINSGMHGDEKQSVISFYLLFKSWLNGENWGNYILDQYDIIIMPCCNPWGMDYATTHTDHSATSDDYCGGRLNSRKTNINRNFPYLWSEYEDGEKAGSDYKGPYALSENETQAMYNLLNSYSALYYRNLICLDLHDFDFIGVHDNDGDRRRLWMTSNSRHTRFRFLKTISYVHEQLVKAFPDMEVQDGDIFAAWQQQGKKPSYDNWGRTQGHLCHLMEVGSWFTDTVHFNTRTFALGWLTVGNFLPGLLDVGFKINQGLTCIEYNDVSQNTYEATLAGIVAGLTRGSRFIRHISHDNFLRDELPDKDTEAGADYGILEVLKTPAVDSDNMSALIRWTMPGKNKMYINMSNSSGTLKGWQEVTLV